MSADTKPSPQISETVRGKIDELSIAAQQWMTQGNFPRFLAARSSLETYIAQTEADNARLSARVAELEGKDDV